MNLFEDDKANIIMLKSVKTLFVFGLIFLSGTALRSDEDNQIKLIVIDAGHGGKDPGTRGRISKEKDVVLDLALQLAKKIKIEMPNVRVILTRQSDKFVDLSERAAIANRRKADLFISIHCNASPSSKSVHGTETFTMGLHKSDENLEVAKRENAVILQEVNYKEKYKDFDPKSPLTYIKMANRQSAFMASSLDFASKIEKQFKTHGERSSRGVKQAGFIVLWQTAMPSVLIEAGFLSNAEEERYLNTADGQETIVESVFRAFKEYKEEVEDR